MFARSWTPKNVAMNILCVCERTKNHSNKRRILKAKSVLVIDTGRDSPFGQGAEDPTSNKKKCLQRLYLQVKYSVGQGSGLQPPAVSPT